MAEPKAKPGWIVIDDEIPYVTPDMLDWWWVNMEKGYQVWYPGEHESFEWLVPPSTDTHIGAIQIAGEFGQKIHIGWMDPNKAPQEIKDWLTFPHVLLCASLDPNTRKPRMYFSHQYESTSYGTHMRSTFHGLGELPPEARLPGREKLIVEHQHGEVGTFKDFLPELYKMWQVVKDPTVNRQCSLKIIKEGSTFKYVK
jgi:hypothetical protein